MICAPRPPQDNRRDEIWKWVRGEWLERHFPYPIFEGVAVGAGNARNQAAREAGDWDVCLFNDADTIAHPQAVAAAIDRAAGSMQIVIAADSHMYMSEESSNRIMAGDLFMPRPYKVDQKSVYRGVVDRPCSGVFAVSRKLWDATGGYIELMEADGAEDQAFMEQARIFGDGITHIHGHMTYHCWHPPGPDRYQTPSPNHRRNHQIWLTLARMSRYRHAKRAEARQYLASLGHHIP